MTRTNKLLGYLAASSLSLSLLCGSALADVSVQKQDSGWHVEANAEPITQVLTELGKQSGLKISGTRKLITDPQITGTYDGDMKTVLARILRGVDYATETTLDENGQTQITRLIVLSGQIGQAPSARAVRTARRVAAPPTAAEQQQAKEDGARVTGLLETKARVVAGLDTSVDTSGDNTPAQPAATNGSGITRNPDGTFEIDPATQAQMAEATRRAQADLQALVNALRQNEDNAGD